MEALSAWGLGKAGIKKISKVALMYQANQPPAPLDLIDLAGWGQTAPAP